MNYDYNCQKKLLKKLIIIPLAIIFLLGCSPRSQSPEQVARVIHQSVFTVDSHADTPWSLLRGDFDLSDRHDYKTDRSRVDFPRMREGGLDAIFMAAFVGQSERNEEGNQKAFDKVDQIIDSLHAHLATRQDEAVFAGTPDEAYQIEKENKRIIFIGIENGYGIGNDLGNIKYFYDKGARYITLCHTLNNDICDSSTDTLEHFGLSKFGEKVVQEMNRTGMMIDVSHISDSSFYDVLKFTKKPVIASHSCAWALCDNPRNLKDDMLRQLARNGGVAQMCILSDYVKNPEPFPERDSARQAVKEKYRGFDDLTTEEMKMARKDWYAIDTLFPAKLASVSDMVDHIDHMVEVAGINHVGIGTDFDGGGGLSDCQDVSQMGNITLELVKRGYSEEDIRKIWGGNIMRVMKEVQQIDS
jgi:membrane dipeptidase